MLRIFRKKKSHLVLKAEREANRTFFLEGKVYWATFHHEVQSMYFHKLDLALTMGSENPSAAEFRKVLEHGLALKNQAHVRVELSYRPLP